MGPRNPPAPQATPPPFGAELLHCVTSGAGPPLVLIHGVAGSHRIWDLVTPFLEEHRTVVRLDLLGYGKSPSPRAVYDPKRHIEAIRRTLIHHQVPTPFTVIGLSMGAILALEYGSTWPGELDGMINIGFPYYPTESAARLGLQCNLWTRLAVNHSAIAGILIPPLWFAGRHLIGLTASGRMLYTKPMIRDALRARSHAFRSSVMDSMVLHRPAAALEASAELPRLFLHGSTDQWASPDDVAAAIASAPRSELRVTPNGPHNLAVAEPQSTAAQIIAWLGAGDRRGTG